MQRVFVSSTQQDLKEYRQAVAETIQGLGHYADTMEFWPADGRAPATYSTDRVRQSDVLVLLLARRYGFVPPGQRSSVTELEYDAAREAGLPVLAFFLDEHIYWPPEHIEWGQQDRLRAFKDKVENEVTRQTFSTPPGLALKVTQALATLGPPASGRPVPDAPTKQRHRHGTSYSEEELDEVADRLAEAVGRQLEQERIADPLSVRLAKTRHPGLAHYDDNVFADENVRARWASGFSSDRLDELVDAFERLPRRRLVILGGPGAGKTELSASFARLLMKRRRPKGPVPVLLSLSAGDPGEGRWIARQLVDRYGLALGAATRGGLGLASELVTTGRVLPVLDGLDASAGSSPDIVSRLNEVRRSVVLTCRVAEYETAITRIRHDDTYHPVLLGAPVIELQPLPPDEVEQYLYAATPPIFVDKWNPVFAHLREHPDGPLATALSTPLMVWLTRTVYANRSNDPVELLDFADRESIEGHLLDQLIPAVYSDQPSPRQVTRWLAFLASLLRQLNTSSLAWWELPRATPLPVTGLALGAIGGLLAGFGVMVGVGVGRAIEVVHGLGLDGAVVAGFWATADFAGVGIGLGVVAGVVTGASGWRSAKTPPAPVTLAFRGRGKAKPPIRRLVEGARPGILGASVFGLVVMLLFGANAGWQVTLAAFVVAPLATGTGWLPWFQTLTDMTRAVRPSAALKQDRNATLANMLGNGLLAGLLAAMTVEVVVRPTDLPPDLAAGFTVGIGAAVLRGTRTAWVHFLIAKTWLAFRGLLPWSLMSFLDGAYGEKKKVLRRVGGVYHFRHALHQNRLAAEWEQANPPALRERKSKPLIPVVMGCVLIVLTVLGAAVLRESTRTAKCDPPTTAEPPVHLAQSRCVLRPSTSVFKNYLDKIDLDTSAPGHGGTAVLIGYDRVGGPAEIIIGYDKIHRASAAPGYVRIDRDQPADRYTCQSALRDRTRRVPSIPNDQLHKGDRLCVETDENRIALVRILEPPIGPRPRLVISFVVWDG